MSRDDKRGTISRLRDIAQIATKHGFGYVFRRGGSGEGTGPPICGLGDGGSGVGEITGDSGNGSSGSAP